jgi:glycerol-3-phosphate dehydrogenase
MWTHGWRDRVWSAIDQQWDIIIIGGGITGAGILREAVRAGLKALLVEAQDFAAGTSSRSSKLVHGGFRYLKNAQFYLTRQAVLEREKLLKEGRGLINQLGFLMPSYTSDRIPAFVMGAALSLYDLLALNWSHRFYDASDIQAFCPFLSEVGLRGGFRFFDAQTDDARLVLRILREAVQEGGAAINYTKAINILQTGANKVCGVTVMDMAPPINSQNIAPSQRTHELQAKVVINATGAWGDILRSKIAKPARLRKLRGSHLIIPFDRIPLRRAMSWFHPADQRPIFALPWEGVTIVGTTDVEHTAPLTEEPVISSAETIYLLSALKDIFPALELSIRDIQSTYAGVRPVINTGKVDPSKESREHVLWNENGLLTVAGGKLTTFRIMAFDALKAVQNTIGQRLKLNSDASVFNSPPVDIYLPDELEPKLRVRLLGRYGGDIQSLSTSIKAGELKTIAGSLTLISEIRWTCRTEGVIHLSDLMLRRTRLGLQLPEGGLRILNELRDIICEELLWGKDRWQLELQSYADLWKGCYYLAN